MIDINVVDLSRLQFALTALYHFLFVPLTLGLSMLLVIMEAVYVMTGRDIWKQMTQFWGVLFGINFAMGVATGITMEFQFGTNWAYLLSLRRRHLRCAARARRAHGVFPRSRLSSACSSSAGSASQGRLICSLPSWSRSARTSLRFGFSSPTAGCRHPVGARFNSDTMRMELTSFSEVIFNPVAQAKFVHTVAAGYVTGAVFVLAISAWYLLNKRNRGFARRSMAVAASFGLASALLGRRAR